MKTPASFSRRDFLKQSLTAAIALPLVAQSAVAAQSSPVLDIGSRRELFVDDFLIEKLAGQAELRLHQPEPKEIALVHDAPWEGSGSGYHSVFEPFYRPKTAETATIEGTGLGLHLVKNIVERHHGDMLFESVYHEGSNFGFSLPFAFSD